MWRVRATMGLGAALLAACSGGSSREAEGQVAARVNDGDVTVHQVRYATQRLQRLQIDPASAARRALDQLVEQELSAQSARAQGLDRDPAVIQALEAARREVLARAWQDRLASAATRPAADEVDRYYDAHPALFAQRRLYVLQETLVEGGAAEHERVARIAREARGAQALEDTLFQSHLRFRSRQFAQAAEDLPMALVEPMARLESGQSLVLEQAGLRVYTVLQFELAPIARRAARDAIESFLLAERKRKAVAEGMKAVRDKARVEYRGNFAQAAASAPASAPR